jgi:hypothetical protein
VTEIEKHGVVAEKAAAKRLSNAEALDGGKKWQGKYPMLCMMHALLDHNEIKRAYLTRHDLPSGQICVRTHLRGWHKMYGILLQTSGTMFCSRHPPMQWIVIPFFWS